MQKRLVSIEQCVGSALSHDLTRIIPGQVKETAFKKGHVVRENDLPLLKDMGRRNLYVLTLGADDLHENVAAAQLARMMSGQGLVIGEAAEGKVNLTAGRNGLLKVNAKALASLNAVNDLAVSTLHTNTPCQKGELVAAAKIVPLVVSRGALERAKNICARMGPILEVKPFLPLQVGAVITGSEIVSGRVRDGFDLAVRPRLAAYGASLLDKVQVGDDPARIAEAIAAFAGRGADMVLVTGGLSVDPDDRTRLGVRKVGARQVFYGTPVLPGAMFLYALLGSVPVLGLPACVFYNHRTVFDLLLPRFMAGERPTRAQIWALGHGGLCRLCDECDFPRCSFGKGGA